MRRIEDFCRNLCHDEDIEEQISGAQSSGIITSYRLTTLAAMNARRDANLCLWCDEIWYANHLHSCSYAPDYNCMFTCGKDFEVFAFVKVSKAGLKHMPVKNLQDRVHVSCADKVFDEMRDEVHVGRADNVFDEMSRNEFEAGEMVDVVNGQGNVHQVFDKISEPKSCQIEVENAVVDNMFNEMQGNEIEASDAAESENGQNETQVSVPQVFDELPRSNLSSNTLVLPAQDENSLIHETGELQVGPYENVEQNIENIDIQYSVESMYEAAECNVHQTNRESFEIRRRMIAKLSKLETPYFLDLVILGAHCERFSTLTSVLRYCSVSDKLPRDASEHYGAIFQVNVKPFVVLPRTRFPKFAENVVWPLVTNMNWFMSPSFSVIFGVSIHSLRTFDSKIGREAFLDFKELHSWGFFVSSSNYPFPELSIERRVIEEFVGKLRAMLNKCALNICIFDPGGRRWSVINVARLRKSEMLGFVFDRGRHMVTSIISGTRILSFLCNGDEEIVSLFLCYGETSPLFDGLLFNKTVVMMFRVTVIDLVISGICVKAVIISHTLEDKGDFEAVGNSDVRLVKVDTYILNVTRVRADSSSLCPPSIILSQRSAARTLAPQHIVSTSALRVPRDAACKIVVLLATSIVSVRFPQVLVAPPLALATSFHWSSLVRSIDSGNKVGKFHRLVFETMPCLSFDIETLLNRLREKQNEATAALCNSDLKGYIYDDSEVVMPKQDLLFCHGWLFNWININSVVYSTHVFDPGGEKLEGIQWDLDGVFNNGPFSVGIHGRNNMMTSFSNLLKENLRVAILSFGVLIVTYIFDPGGSLVNLFDRVIGIIACLIFDP